MSDIVRVTIPGNPVAQGRGRVARWKAKDGREGLTVRDPAKARNWKAYAQDLIRQAWGGRPAWTGPVGVRLVCAWPCPKSQERKRSPRRAQWRPTRGRDDVDNLLKAVLDAMTGVAFLDDGQVVEVWVRKIQAAQGDPGKVVVEVRTEDPEYDPTGTPPPRVQMGRGIDALLPFGGGL